jgi:hypothetical protein
MVRKQHKSAAASMLAFVWDRRPADSIVLGKELSRKRLSATLCVHKRASSGLVRKRSPVFPRPTSPLQVPPPPSPKQNIRFWPSRGIAI